MHVSILIHIYFLEILPNIIGIFLYFFSLLSPFHINLFSYLLSLIWSIASGILLRQTRCYLRYISLFYANEHFSEQYQPFLCDLVLWNPCFVLLSLFSLRLHFPCWHVLEQGQFYMTLASVSLFGAILRLSCFCGVLMTEHKLKDWLVIIYITIQWHSGWRWLKKKNPWGAPGGKIYPCAVSFAYFTEVFPIKSCLWFDLTTGFPGGCAWLFPWLCFWSHCFPKTVEGEPLGPLWLSAWKSPTGPQPPVPPAAFRLGCSSLAGEISRSMCFLVFLNLPPPFSKLGCVVCRTPKMAPQDAHPMEMGFLNQPPV